MTLDERKFPMPLIDKFMRRTYFTEMFCSFPSSQGDVVPFSLRQ